MILGHFNYFASLILVLYGIFVMITEFNLIKKIIGLTILQTGVILFFVSVSVKDDGSLPIVKGGLGQATIDQFANPLPHALMLTAIVVGVSTLGVALVLAVSIFKSHETLEEDDILKKVAEDHA